MVLKVPGARLRRKMVEWIPCGLSGRPDGDAELACRTRETPVVRHETRHYRLADDLHVGGKQYIVVATGGIETPAEYVALSLP